MATKEVEKDREPDQQMGSGIKINNVQSLPYVDCQLCELFGEEFPVQRDSMLDHVNMHVKHISFIHSTNRKEIFRRCFPNCQYPIKESRKEIVSPRNRYWDQPTPPAILPNDLPIDLPEVAPTEFNCYKMAKSIMDIAFTSAKEGLHCGLCQDMIKPIDSPDDIISHVTNNHVDVLKYDSGSVPCTEVQTAIVKDRIRLVSSTRIDYTVENPEYWPMVTRRMRECFLDEPFGQGPVENDGRNSPLLDTSIPQVDLVDTDVFINADELSMFRDNDQEIPGNNSGQVKEAKEKETTEGDHDNELTMDKDTIGPNKLDGDESDESKKAKITHDQEIGRVKKAEKRKSTESVDLEEKTKRSSHEIGQKGQDRIMDSTTVQSVPSSQKRRRQDSGSLPNMESDRSKSAGQIEDGRRHKSYAGVQTVSVQSTKQRHASGSAIAQMNQESMGINDNAQAKYKRLYFVEEESNDDNTSGSAIPQTNRDNTSGQANMKRMEEPQQHGKGPRLSNCKELDTRRNSTPERSTFKNVHQGRDRKSSVPDAGRIAKNVAHGQRDSGQSIQRPNLETVQHRSNVETIHRPNTETVQQRPNLETVQRPNVETIQQRPNVERGGQHGRGETEKATKVPTSSSPEKEKPEVKTVAEMFNVDGTSYHCLKCFLRENGHCNAAKHAKEKHNTILLAPKSNNPQYGNTRKNNDESNWSQNRTSQMTEALPLPQSNNGNRYFERKMKTGGDIGQNRRQRWRR